MKRLSIVLFTFLIAPVAGAEIMKLRLNPETFRIVLTGQDAQRLIASAAGKSVDAAGPLESLSCLKEISRCELSIKSKDVLSYESVQEHLRLADNAGLSAPDVELPHNATEQMVITSISDSAVAERVYSVLPGPELPFNLDRTIAKEFNGTVKNLDLRNGVFLSCENIEHSTASRKGYSCLMRMIVPSGHT